MISPEGKQLGVLPTATAISLALEVGLELVEVAPAARPPVCRIMDFGKYVYEESKKTSHAKVTASKIKEIELTPRIEQHDFETKIRHAEEFLSHGSKVKLRLKFRGREMARTELGFDVIRRAIADLEGMGHPDSEPRLIGRNINMMITPLPENKRKPKYYHPHHHEAAAEDDEPRAHAKKAESAHAEDSANEAASAQPAPAAGADE
ncbi:translation initiation factor IF-3 [Cephaloticoccus capnophilus]|uniref:Translation initiation factor IF-3 n=1 Tax=Cephaloticoccus capnophilus TaxID=1548208 RepID=A0A139SM87_9BACT|nr:translation initiation factor IF-3 [Cephaloticoccus capnophilus]